MEPHQSALESNQSRIHHTPEILDLIIEYSTLLSGSHSCTHVEGLPSAHTYTMTSINNTPVPLPHRTLHGHFYL
jgi:hypothetical protein